MKFFTITTLFALFSIINAASNNFPLRLKRQSSLQSVEAAAFLLNFAVASIICAIERDIFNAGAALGVVKPYPACAAYDSTHSSTTMMMPTPTASPTGMATSYYSMPTMTMSM